MLPAHLRPEVRAAVVEARQALAALYGERLVRVVLYGSQARGDAREGSDVDLLVVLRGPVRDYDEMKQTTALWWPAVQRHGVDLSIFVYDEATYADFRRPFIRNVRAEGVSV